MVVAERARDAEESKYRIAETAMALFLQEGYESVTVEAVAEASRLSRRTVFRHFRSKDELPFPDHSARLAQLQRRLDSAGPDEDPVEAVIAGTEESLLDFLSRPRLVLARYQLTRVVPELRNREIIEHERYVTLTSAFLREHLPDGTPGFQAAGLAALIDAMHRTALGNWTRSGGETDAVAELGAGMTWVRTLTAEPLLGPGRQMLLAVLPDTPEARRSLTSLRDRTDGLT